jgi:hypothetical protein
MGVLQGQPKKGGDVVYYFTIRKPGSQEKWKTGIME